MLFIYVHPRQYEYKVEPASGYTNSLPICNVPPLESLSFLIGERQNASIRKIFHRKVEFF